MEDKDKLFKSYRDNKFRNKLILFKIILLNYKIIFYLNDVSHYEIFSKCFFYIHDENNFFIVRNYINQTFDDEKMEMTLLLPLFLFLQEIRDIIEIEINKIKINLMNILIPDIFNLKKYSKSFLKTIINYSDRENQFLSIYNYIECLIYDIKTEKNCLNNLYENLLNYKIEFINYFFVLVENIALIFLYSKSTKGSIEKYNEIDNMQNFNILSYIIRIHGVILLFIFFGWFKYRRKIDYFNSLTKYINTNSEILDKLSLDKKIKLIKINSNINEFLPKDSETRYKRINYFTNNCIEEVIEKFILYLKRKIKLRKYIYCLKKIYFHLYLL